MSCIQISRNVVYSCLNRQVGHSTLFSVDFITLQLKVVLEWLAVIPICIVPGANHVGLSPSDYSLIPKVKQLLKGQQYANREDTLIAL
jgi:hypothetical protein